MSEEMGRLTVFCNYYMHYNTARSLQLMALAFLLGPIFTYFLIIFLIRLVNTCYVNILPLNLPHNLHFSRVN